MARPAHEAEQGLSAAAATAQTGWLARLRARLAARSDTEHEQAIVRLAITVLLAASLIGRTSRWWLCRSTRVTRWLRP